MTDLLPEMPCREFVEVVTDYLEGALSADDHARFVAHLGVCEACALYMEQLRLTKEAVGQVELYTLSPAARAELLGAFRGWATTT